MQIAKQVYEQVDFIPSAEAIKASTLTYPNGHEVKWNDDQWKTPMAPRAMTASQSGH
jgi:hypothetical protein